MYNIYLKCFYYYLCWCNIRFWYNSTHWTLYLLLFTVYVVVCNAFVVLGGPSVNPSHLGNELWRKKPSPAAMGWLYFWPLWLLGIYLCYSLPNVIPKTRSHVPSLKTTVSVNLRNLKMGGLDTTWWHRVLSIILDNTSLIHKHTKNNSAEVVKIR